MKIKFVMSRAFAEKYGGLEMMAYQHEVMQALKTYPVDMFVFEENQGIMSVRCAGYHMWGKLEGTLDEETIVKRFESLPTDKFWCKIDVYPEELIGTFLFPQDY